jgi:hypothetical protein
MNARTQREKIIEWLREKPLNTLDARDQLYIMSPATRIFELKERGMNIVTKKIKVGGNDCEIAQYVLLSEAAQ